MTITAINFVENCDNITASKQNIYENSYGFYRNCARCLMYWPEEFSPSNRFLTVYGSSSMEYMVLCQLILLNATDIHIL